MSMACQSDRHYVRGLGGTVMSNDQQVAKKPQSSMTPAYMQGAKDMGIDSIEQKDVITPRIAICQAMSKVKKKNEKVKEGHLYHTLEHITFGKVIEFFCLQMYKSVVWFDPDKNVLAGYEYYNKKTKEYTRYGKDMDDIKKDPVRYANGRETYNYMIVLAKELERCIASGTSPTVFIYSAARAASKAAKQLNGRFKVNAQRNVPIYGQKVSFATESIEFEKGPSFMPVFTWVGLAKKEEFVNLAQGFEIAKSLMGKESTHAGAAASEDEDQGSAQEQEPVDEDTQGPVDEDPFNL